jgi:hypothetical protein
MSVNKGKQQKEKKESTRLGHEQRGPKARATQHRARGYLEKSVRKETKTKIKKTYREWDTKVDGEAMGAVALRKKKHRSNVKC